jgi:hypothetical protein
MKETTYILWAGAGISSPSGMPLGNYLTDKWLSYFLPDKEYKEILRFYENQKDVVGKQFPRLEKIIDDSIGVFGEKCLDVLNFMKEITPNSIHHTISNYILNKRTYSFTTNFDVGVEKSEIEKIEVHSLSGVNSADWGLVKIHGCIQESNTNWGITISNLQNGLMPWIEKLLLELLEQEEYTFVFLGYSSSDYFDVIPFFQKIYREKIKLNSKVIWIDHDDEIIQTLDMQEEEWMDKLSWGITEILEAFPIENVTVKKGKTDKILATIIPDYFVEKEIKTKINWQEGWENYIIPSEELKTKFAFKFYSSIGYGKKSLSLLKPPTKITRYNLEVQRYLNSLRDCGYYESEFRIRKYLRKKESDFSRVFFTRHYLASLRLSRRFIKAFFLYTYYVFKYYNSNAFNNDNDNKNSAMLLIAESGLFYQSILHKVPRNLITVLLTLPIEHTIRRLMLISVILYQKYTKDNSSGNDPHLKAIINRTNDFLTIPIFQTKHLWGALNRLDYLNHKGLDFTDFTDGLYIETDSFLGVVNFQRNRAYNNFRYLHLGLFYPKANNFNDSIYSEIEDATDTSLKTAKLIEDIPGQAKAYLILSKLAYYKKDLDGSIKNRNESRRLKKELKNDDKITGANK